MALSDLVNITITTEAAQVTRAGFGVPLILSPETPGGFTERVRFYTSITALAVDFATTTSTYKIAARVFSQSPRPPKLAVGRCANKPTQSWTITPIASNSTVYSGIVDGSAWTFTSDSTATLTEVCEGIASAIDAASNNLTCTNVANTHVTCVATAAAQFHSLSVNDISRMALVQDHVDPGLAADISAIVLEDASWYACLYGYNSNACVEVISDAIEPLDGKLFITQLQDSTGATVANSSDTTSAMAEAKESARTVPIYHPETDAFTDAALAAKCLPLDPGSETWAYKTLTGVSTVALTATQRTNLLAKKCNIYTEEGGIGITFAGTVGAGEFVDVVRFRDWLKARLQENIFAALASARKVPFTDEGISVIVGVIKGVLKEGVRVGGLAADPEPNVVAPKAADVSAADKAARALSGVTFSATLAGAVHLVTVTGTLSV